MAKAASLARTWVKNGSVDSAHLSLELDRKGSDAAVFPRTGMATYDRVTIASKIEWWYDRPLVEIFPPPKGTHRSPLYRRILSEFFEWSVPG